MMTLLYLLLLPMLSGIGMLGLGPALMAGRAGAAHVVLLLSGLLLPLRGLMYLLLARRRGNRPGRMSACCWRLSSCCWARACCSCRSCRCGCLPWSLRCI